MLVKGETASSDDVVFCGKQPQLRSRDSILTVFDARNALSTPGQRRCG